MTIMRDSTNPWAIPVDTPCVAGYVDGAYVWSEAGWARFPNADKRRISTTTVNTPSDVADVEKDNVSAVERLTWYQNMKAAGETDLWLYCNRANRQTVEDIFWNAGIRDVKMWIATLDGTQTVPPYRYPVVAVQYIDTGQYDESIIDDSLFGPSGGGGLMTQDQIEAVIRNALGWAVPGRAPTDNDVATWYGVYQNGTATNPEWKGNLGLVVLAIQQNPDSIVAQTKLANLLKASPATGVPAHKHIPGDVQT